MEHLSYRGQAERGGETAPAIVVERLAQAGAIVDDLPALRHEAPRLVAPTLTVHHGALAFLLGINGLRDSEVASVRIEDYQETLRGHRVLHLIGKGSKPATMPLTSGAPCTGSLPRATDRRAAGPTSGFG